jgi:hypothetical protein
MTCNIKDSTDYRDFWMLVAKAEDSFPVLPITLIITGVIVISLIFVLYLKRKNK